MIKNRVLTTPEKKKKTIFAVQAPYRAQVNILQSSQQRVAGLEPSVLTGASRELFDLWALWITTSFQ